MCTYVLSSSSSQLCPSHTSHHLCLMVQSILLASSEAPATPMPTPPPPDREGSTPPCSQGTTLPSSQGSSLSFLSSLKGQALPPRLRAHAYITLGMYIRMCVSMCVRVHTYVCMYVCTYVCMYICTYVCASVHTYVIEPLAPIAWAHIRTYVRTTPPYIAPPPFPVMYK